MSCPSAQDILRLVAGELEPEHEHSVREHLAGCAACAESWAEMAATWDVLREWRVDVGEPDLATRVLAECEGHGATGTDARLFRWPAAIRAAASILVAVGLGMGAARLLPIGNGRQVNAPTSALTAEEAAHELGLTGFASESATGLMLDFDSSTPPEGGIQS